MIGKFLTSQLRKPSGWFGKQIVARVLNKDNASMNDLTFLMLDFQSNQKQCQVLELGFGGGYLLDKILQIQEVKSVTGIDISPEMVDLCERRFALDIKVGKLQLQCGDAENLPEFDNSFTHICTVNTIYFWSDIQKVLTNLYQVLEEEGILVICFNTKDFLERTKLAKYGFKSYDFGEIERIMKISGFQDIKQIYKFESQQSFVCVVGRK